jgi:phenylpropionate dioxygenase-like ring-hydroxylating dioxygenase large terminal subunit
MPLVFPFDPDIRRAATIPSRLYIDPVYLELEQDQVFGRTWQLIGRAESVDRSGAYLTARIGREAVVAVRDGQVLRGFHNICLHRAGPVAEGCGRRQTLQCGYHGWTYRLDGSLLRAPEMEEAEGFEAADMHLLPVQVAAWGPLIFANLDLKAPPLAHFLDDIPERTARFRPEAMRFVTRKSWTIACNWKVYIDNYLEGYHLPVVHPGLYKELDYDQYRVEPHRYYSLQHAPLRSGDGPERRYHRLGADEDAQYYWLFPNTMLNIYQGQMQTNQVIPRGADRCEVVFEWYAAEAPSDEAAEAAWRRLVQFSDEIQAEDIAICERVQENLQSRRYDRGRYSPAREVGVHHFHGLLHEFLT